MNDWQEAKVVKAKLQTKNFITLILKPKKYKNFKSGNFVELAVSKNGPFKCYSVVSSPFEKGTYEVGVKLYKGGALSPHLFKLKEGDSLLMRGPTGIHFIWEKNKNDTVLVAGGAGICPMVSILRQFNGKNTNMKLLFSTKKKALYYIDELNKLCGEKSVEFSLVKTGEDKRITKTSFLASYGEDINSKADFFVAGPPTFVQHISMWLYEAGISPNNLKTDDFGVS